jgi:autotransporter-associated beta strand protein
LNLTATRTFDVAFSASLEIQTPVTGAGGITKAGAGWMRLLYPNTYSGLTVVQAGTFSVGSASSLGTTNSGTIVSNSASLWLRSGLTVTDEPVTLYGTLEAADSGSVTWSGPVILGADSVIRADITDSVFLISGVISGVGGITKRGPGTLLLAGSMHNSYSGNTYVNEGVLDLHKTTGYRAIPNGMLQIGDGIGGDRADIVLYACGDNGLIGSSVLIVVTNSGLLDLNGHDETVGTITLAGGDITLGAGTL